MYTNILGVRFMSSIVKRTFAALGYNVDKKLHTFVLVFWLARFQPASVFSASFYGDVVSDHRAGCGDYCSHYCPAGELLLLRNLLANVVAK